MDQQKIEAFEVLIFWQGFNLNFERVLRRWEKRLKKLKSIQSDFIAHWSTNTMPERIFTAFASCEKKWKRHTFVYPIFPLHCSTVNREKGKKCAEKEITFRLVNK